MTKSGRRTTISPAVAAALAEGERAGHAAGFTEGFAAQRARIITIMECSEARGREDLAQHLALHTDMDQQAAIAALAAAGRSNVIRVHFGSPRSARQKEGTL